MQEKHLETYLKKNPHKSGYVHRERAMFPKKSAKVLLQGTKKYYSDYELNKDTEKLSKSSAIKKKLLK